MSSDIAIKVENLSKCYQIYEQPRDRLKQFVMPLVQRALFLKSKLYCEEFWALKNISFEVKRGETVGIIGRNGSGKSTLLQIICGTLTPTSGTVTTKGRIAALLELGSGFNPDFTGRENIYMNAAVLGLSTEEIDLRFDAIAAFAEIGEFIERPIKMYSSGMMVRLAFAVAINVEPDILVVDEALSVGDELFQRKCFSRIETIRANGATILFVSHSGSQIVELCDRAIFIDSGEKLTEGAPKIVVGHYQKMLYATDLKRDELREGVKSHNLNYDEESTKSEFNNELRSDSYEIPLNNLEVLNPSLIPTSTIYYEANGAKIREPHISTKDGQVINNLIQGRVYRYTYIVDFDKDANNVRFGMLIKTITGYELGGSASANSNLNHYDFVSAGSKYRVEFLFNCSLTGGTYFLNAGVVGEVNGSEYFLHRVIDAAMFRVHPVDGFFATGTVDFGCQLGSNLILDVELIK